MSRAADRPVLMPLAPGRFKVQMTIGVDAHKKLRRVQDLMRHTIPNGDLAAIFDRALTLLLADLERKKLAATKGRREGKKGAGSELKTQAGRDAGGLARDRGTAQPPSAPSAGQSRTGRFHPEQPRAEQPPAAAPNGERPRIAQAPNAQPDAAQPSAKQPRVGQSRTEQALTSGRNCRSRSRHIPAAVIRAVWSRDGGRCTYVGPAGRCTQTGGLEFHHVVPFAVGGATSVEGLALRCKPHNAYEAEEYFGRCHHARPPSARHELVPGPVDERRAEWREPEAGSRGPVFGGAAPRGTTKAG